MEFWFHHISMRKKCFKAFQHVFFRDINEWMVTCKNTEPTHYYIAREDAAKINAASIKVSKNSSSQCTVIGALHLEFNIEWEAQASWGGSGILLDVFLVRFPQEKTQRNPGHAGGTIFLCWPGDAWRAAWSGWREGSLGHCFSCCQSDSTAN